MELTREDQLIRYERVWRALTRLKKQQKRQVPGSSNYAKTRQRFEKKLRKLRPLERALGLPRSEWAWDSEYPPNKPPLP